MSFIQCKDRDEAEKKMGELEAGYVSADFRIYDKIEFWDKWAVWHIAPKTLLALYELQSQIEMMLDGGSEMAFDGVVEQAQELEAAFKKVLTAIKFKPILRSKREGHS